MVRNTPLLTSIFGFLILIGIAWFIYFTFVDKTNDQDRLLIEIRNNQTSLEELNIKLEEQNGKITTQQLTIDKLSSNICILQNQISSLGATPTVNDEFECNFKTVTPK